MVVGLVAFGPARSFGLYLIPRCQTAKRHLILYLVMGDQQVAPGCSTILVGVIGSVFAPDGRCFFLSLDNLVGHLASSFGLTQEFPRLGFHYEVRLL